MVEIILAPLFSMLKFLQKKVFEILTKVIDGLFVNQLMMNFFIKLLWLSI